MGWGRAAEGGWGSGVTPGVPPGTESGKRDLAGCFPGQIGSAELRVSAGRGGEQQATGSPRAGEEGHAGALGGLGVGGARPAGSTMGNSHHGIRGVWEQPPGTGTPEGGWTLCQAGPGPPDGWVGVLLRALLESLQRA